MVSVLCQKVNNHPCGIFAGPHLDCSYSHTQQLELVQACFHQSLSTKRERCWEGSFACFVRSSAVPYWTWKRFSQVASTLQHYTSHRGFLQVCLKVLVLVETILVDSKPFDIRCRHIYPFELCKVSMIATWPDSV